MSTVKIVKPDERLVYTIGDTKFYYKRIATSHASALRRKHTKRGDLDGEGLATDVLNTYLLGWENVQDWDDNDVPFTEENIFLIPDQILAEIITVINGSEGELAETKGVAAIKLKQDEVEKKS